MTIRIYFKFKLQDVLLLSCLGIFMCCFSFSSNAQVGSEYKTTPDSTFLLSHSPHKATFLSACVPGLGQIYNEKYWKVPIIYAGFTGLIYYANYTNFTYNKYKDAYDIRLKIDAGNTELVDEYDLPAANLKRLKDNWRRYRDLNLISIGLLYVMQMLDANVDAHLFDYDISEDLSMRFEPSFLQTPNFSNQKYYQSASLGVRCSIRF
ncbi:MAG: hypothetical protein JEZ09_00900 [Salinivirgaceae bacterium]|nr:hypothetical protein [Salinivirgaceae bacterium]